MHHDDEHAMDLWQDMQDADRRAAAAGLMSADFECQAHNECFCPVCGRGLRAAA